MTDLAQLKQSRLYSEELGIDLSIHDDEQYFRWFLTANIFLRELPPFWPKRDPEPLPVVAAAAANAGVELAQYERRSLTFVRIEAGLIRLRHQHRQREPAVAPHSPRFSARDSMAAAAGHRVGVTVTYPVPEGPRAFTTRATPNRSMTKH